MVSSKKAVVLVGHGGVPKDLPSGWVRELKRLESERKVKGGSEPSAEELEADQKIRDWPRTETNDPYRLGLESMGAHLAPMLREQRLKIAYNEFCAPSIPQAVEDLVEEGYRQIALVTTMVTPGGSHADGEIPEIVAELQARFPEVSIQYAWPFDLDQVAKLIHHQVAQLKFPD